MKYPKRRLASGHLRRGVLKILLRSLKVFGRIDVEGFHFGAERGVQNQVRVSVHYGSAADASVQAAQLTGQCRRKDDRRTMLAVKGGRNDAVGIVLKDGAEVANAIGL